MEREEGLGERLTLQRGPVEERGEKGDTAFEEAAEQLELEELQEQDNQAPSVKATTAVLGHMPSS